MGCLYAYIISLLQLKISSHRQFAKQLQSDTLKTSLQLAIDTALKTERILKESSESYEKSVEISQTINSIVPEISALIQEESTESTQRFNLLRDKEFNLCMRYSELGQHLVYFSNKREIRKRV